MVTMSPDDSSGATGRSLGNGAAEDSEHAKMNGIDHVDHHRHENEKRFL